MKGLSRRGKVYWCSYTVKDEVTGRRERRRESLHTSLVWEAAERFAQIKRDVERGVINARPKLADCIESYLWERKAMWRPGYYDRVSYVLEGYVLTYFDNRPVDRITSGMIESYLTERPAMKGPKKGQSHRVGPSTLNKERAILSGFFSWCLKRAYIYENPVHKVDTRAVPTERIRYLDDNEVESLFAEIDSREAEHRNVLSKAESPEHKAATQVALNATLELRDMIDFALQTGCRRAEVANLTWDMVDLRQRVLRLSNDRERGFVLKNAQPRDIPLTDRCLALLVRRRQQNKKGLVFSAPADLSRSFRRIVRAAGIKDASFHTLRHTFASKLVQQGVAIFTVKELLGHSTVMLTERHYASLAPKTVEAAIRQLSYGQPRAQNLVTVVAG